MSKIDVNKGLRGWAESVKKDIIREIIRTKTIDTGALLSSINYSPARYSGGLGQWFFEFSMLDYGIYTDRGTRTIAARNFFEKVIVQNTDNLDQFIEDDVQASIELAFERSLPGRAWREDYARRKGFQNII